MKKDKYVLTAGIKEGYELFIEYIENLNIMKAAIMENGVEDKESASFLLLEPFYFNRLSGKDMKVELRKMFEFTIKRRFDLNEIDLVLDDFNSDDLDLIVDGIMSTLTENQILNNMNHLIANIILSNPVIQSQVLTELNYYFENYEDNHIADISDTRSLRRYDSDLMTVFERDDIFPKVYEYGTSKITFSTSEYKYSFGSLFGYLIKMRYRIWSSTGMPFYSVLKSLVELYGTRNLGTILNRLLGFDLSYIPYLYVFGIEDIMKEVVDKSRRHFLNFNYNIENGLEQNVTLGVRTEKKETPDDDFTHDFIMEFIDHETGDVIETWSSPFYVNKELDRVKPKVDGFKEYINILYENNRLINPICGFFNSDSYKISRFFGLVNNLLNYIIDQSLESVYVASEGK